MTEPLQLYFFRHGETIWSLTGQHTGCTDLPLTPNGRHMARGLARRRQGLAFEQVWVSPRQRARQTCELAGLSAGLVTLPDLAEWNCGEYEGRCSAEIRLTRPGWDVWRDGCPGGESAAEVSARADRNIARVATSSGRIAPFSHGQFGRALAARWIGLAVEQGRHFALAPASISILGHEAGSNSQRVVLLWNSGASL